MSKGFKFDTSKLLNALVSREMKTKAALGAYADTSSQLLESTAKTIDHGKTILMMLKIGYMVVGNGKEIL
ncbi:hypothetical protein ACD319_07740 [Clostridioides difficile]|uniref:hypothetical protein n=1 Tax=Clostridioides difficile TaxID=1496 RepID=UPI00355BD14F